VPVAGIRGLRWEHDEEASMRSVIRRSENDLFR
jgi:hypothetical protein